MGVFVEIGKASLEASIRISLEVSGDLSTPSQAHITLRWCYIFERSPSRSTLPFPEDESTNHYGMRTQYVIFRM